MCWNVTPSSRITRIRNDEEAYKHHASAVLMVIAGFDSEFFKQYR